MERGNATGEMYKLVWRFSDSVKTFYNSGVFVKKHGVIFIGPGAYVLPR